MVVGQAPLQQFGRAQKGRQEVVEVVGDPAGKPADRLDLLDLAKLVLELLAGGEVGDRPDQTDGLPVGVPEDQSPVQEGGELSGLPPGAVLAGEDLPGPRRQRPRRTGRVVRMDST
jgi:hypothetical protein